MNSTLQDRVSIARDVYFSPRTDDGCILLNLERGTILSLNNSGSLIFSKLAENKSGITRQELVKRVAEVFHDVEVTRVRSVVDDLLLRLDKVGALQTEHGTTDINQFDFRGGLARKVPICVRCLLVPLLFFRAYTLAALVLLFTTEFVRVLGGFRAIHQSVQHWATAAKDDSDDVIANACAAVNRACTWYPKRALCLQRASALVCLLRSLGFPAELAIGVHTMPFYGHAWVELEGRVVNDHANAQRFFQVLNRC